ncbi:MAG: hypothetical protein ACD_87C00038G0003 [uncultured bacterium]|nr:MAG: hypothetical protein ACD_87C00038G0003 [uncultured bacterium]
MYGQVDDLFEPLPVELALLYHQPQVDGSQVARLIREQGLFAARVCRFDGADVRRGVVTVQPIEKNDARLAVFPGMPDDQVEDLPGAHYSGCHLIPGIDQRIGFVALQRLHKGLGQTHRDIEVVQLLLVGLTADEIENIRMIHPQKTHVGASSRTTLLDRLCCDIEDPHERNRAAGNPCGGSDHIIMGAEIGKREPGTAARFMDEGRILNRIEYLIHGVSHGEDKTGGQLAQLAAGIHQCRGIRQELKPRHNRIKLLGQSRRVGVFAEFLIGVGNRFSNAKEHLCRRLGHTAILILA